MEKTLRINPYLVPEHQQGWRGLSLSGNSKRRYYTVLQNEMVLVTALLLIPGERSIRHSHETGELSVHFSDPLRPAVTWNPPGVLHGGITPNLNNPQTVPQDALTQEALLKLKFSEASVILEQINMLKQQVSELQEQISGYHKPNPSPRIIVDVLFPPFRTIIDDPSYPEKRTVVGQWYD